MIGGGGGSIDGRPHRPVARGAVERILPLSVEVALENIVLSIVRCSCCVTGSAGGCAFRCFFSVGTQYATLCEGHNQLLPEAATVFFSGHHRGRYGFLTGHAC